MQISYLKSKIHRATVTDANLDYEGSITIGREMMEAAELRPFERVDVYNVTNGERFHTYVIPGGEGTICLNGAAAWKAKPKDIVIIASYALLSEEEAHTFRPRLVYVGEGNRIQYVAREMKA